MTYSLLSNYPSGLLHLKRPVLSDKRGYFTEIFRKTNPFLENIEFVQDNFSSSNLGVTRGIHYQKPPFEQGKLLTCLKGVIFDVAVDLRLKSPYFGKHWSFTLRGETGEALYLPPGFGHGFCSLEEETLLFYKTTEYYKPEAELVLKWDDSSLGIIWPQEAGFVSEKDLKGLTLHDFTKKIE